LTLHGTLALPEGDGPFPAVVIIAGSGPTDRDGNAPAGLRTAMYELLAEGLAERGIASLRYDKRGLPATEGTFDMAVTTLADFAADAAAGARALDARTEIGPVFFLGHSEGGTLAMLAAREGAPVRGLVLVSAMGRSFTAVLREQLARQLPPPMLAKFDTAWATYIETEDSVDYPPVLASLFASVNRRFVQSWQGIDPVRLLAALEAPVLVVQGETDVQVTPADARALADARPDVTLALLPGVNHVLKEAQGSTANEQMMSYTDPSIPLAPRVVPTLADWVLRHAR
jgi:pimeloyl-ACP methyl ester carboxylesterase